MGFNDTMGNYLIAAQSSLLAPHNFHQHRPMNKSGDNSMDESLQELLKPFEGDLHEATIQAALKYVSLRKLLSDYYSIWLSHNYRLFITFQKM